MKINNYKIIRSHVLCCPAENRDEVRRRHPARTGRPAAGNCSLPALQAFKVSLVPWVEGG
jgi:hypothetical protein